jgi:hypothetical protein
MSTNTKAHPLALPDDYDDDLDNIVDINMSKHKTVDYKKNTNSNASEFLSHNMPSLPVTKLPTTYKKRIAPAPPLVSSQQQQATLTSSASFVSTANSTKRDEQTITSSTNSLTSNSGGVDCYFFIDIHHVRWFYKGEKTDKDNSNSSATSTLNNTDEMTASISSTTSNDSTTTTTSNPTNTNTSLAGNSDVNVHKISSKKWLMFNKTDSYNLELEYRDMISKKLLNAATDPPKTVQVLDSLYEVNITTKKCYSIYWKSRIISVMRVIWYTESGEPFDEKSGEEIEKKHIDLFRGDLLRSFDSDGSLNADIDGLKIGTEASSTSPTEELGGVNPKSKTAEIKIERKFLNKNRNRA